MIINNKEYDLIKIKYNDKVIGIMKDSYICSLPNTSIELKEKESDCNNDLVLCNFQQGDEVVCIIADHKDIPPCEVRTVTSVVGEKFIKLRGYGETLFYKGYFRLYKKRED